MRTEEEIRAEYEKFKKENPITELVTNYKKYDCSDEYYFGYTDAMKFVLGEEK